MGASLLGAAYEWECAVFLTHGSTQKWNAERPGLHSHAERTERSVGSRKTLVG
jgi:hypothetical protein